jgi:multiple sugar transport system permease protein
MPTPKHGQWPLTIFLLVGSGVVLLPFVWMLCSSFKPPLEQAYIPPKLLPNRWIFSNYPAVFDLHPMGRYFLNSVVVSLITTLSAVLLAALAAYGFAKQRFFGSQFFFILILSKLIVPAYFNLIPRFLIVQNLGLLDTLTGIILPEMFTVYGVFWLRQYMLSVPDELLDAGRLDGASEWTILWRIVVPQCYPALAALAIVRFLWSWEEFLWPLIVVQTDANKTMAIGLASYSPIEVTFADYGVIMAAATVVVIPVVILYLLLQRTFIQGVTMTGIKA